MSFIIGIILIIAVIVLFGQINKMKTRLTTLEDGNIAEVKETKVDEE